MDHFRRSLIVAWGNMRRWKTSWHIWLMFLSELAILYSYLNGFNTYAKGTGKTITGFLLPIILAGADNTTGSLKVLVLAGGLLLFCDSPFLSAFKQSMILRCSRREWIIGEMFYLFAASFLYLCLINVFSVLILHPVVSGKASWGKIIGDYMKNPPLLLAYNPGVVIPFSVVMLFTPGSTFLYSITVGTLCLFFLGMITLAMNLILKRQWAGTVVSGLLILMDPVVSYVFLGPKRWILRLSPVSWCSIERLSIVSSGEAVSLQYAICGYLLLLAVLGIASWYAARRADLH